MKLDDDIVTIGISPLFIHSWGYVGQIGYDETSDDQILVIQCGSGGFQPFAKPCAGTPIPGECNNEVLANTDRINDHPCNDNNWLYKMKIAKSS